MLGRDSDLEFLDRTLARARSGSGRAVFVVGEPGIGKSRLVRAVMARAAADGMVVLLGRGSAIGPMVPFRPIVEALLSLSRTSHAPDLAALGPYRGILGRLVPEWSDGRQEHGDFSLVLLGEAMLRLMATVGREGGCLFVLEDLHECDPETLAVIEYLADNLGHQPTMFVATARIEAGRASDLVRSAAQRDSAATVELGRLSEPDVTRLVAGCLDTGPDAVPRSVLAQLWRDSMGVPFIVEELLHDMLSSGSLVRGPGGWQVTGQLRTAVPATLARSIAARVGRLGPSGREVLGVAALLGRRFPVLVVRHALGIDDRLLHERLRAAAAGQLVIFEADDPRYCSFEHPLTAEALRAELAPAERAELAGRAARAVRELHPDLPGEWCQQVAVLLLAADDPAGAAALFAEAGRRALTGGAAQSAVILLERAEGLLTGLGDPVAHAEVVESLLFALAAAGQLDRALHLIETTDSSIVAGLDAARRSALHVRMAWVAEIGGRLTEAAAQIAAARRVLGDDPPDRYAAPVDAVAASLALDMPGHGRTGEAERLALRAVAAAERASLPEVLCDALHVVGAVARGRDRAAAVAAYQRARDVAERHRLPLWPTYSAVRLATLDWLFDGDGENLDHARREALRIGAIGIACNIDAVLALHTVLCGRFADAAERLGRCRSEAKRLQLAHVSRYLAMVAAVLAAHQARREEMEHELAEFRSLGGDSSQEGPLAIGMAGAFCSLLEEDHERAAAELRRMRASEARNPTTFHLAGLDGIHHLMAVLAGEADRDQHDRVRARPGGQMRWNRQFVLLAEAVLLGRENRPEQAARAFDQAQQVAAPYPMARRLGVRLVSSAALADGWGDLHDRLRDAEDYFHGVGMHVVAAACRRLLRRMGRPVPPRRADVDRVPDPLRAAGVTVREYEVLLLLGERLANREIAERLHLSSRTVEKYVANLLVKTGQPDRYRASRYAATLLRDVR